MPPARVCPHCGEPTELRRTPLDGSGPWSVVLNGPFRYHCANVDCPYYRRPVEPERGSE